MQKPFATAQRHNYIRSTLWDSDEKEEKQVHEKDRDREGV
jgi:hypothetical protein